MTRTIGAAIGLVLVVLFFATLSFERTRPSSSPAPAFLTARR
jgi:hypothetical protein